MCISSTEGDPTSVPPDEQNRPEGPVRWEVTEMAEAAECAARVGENAGALGAVGEAGRTSKFVDVVNTLRSPDVRAGRGYLVALLKAQERRPHQP